MRVVLMGPPGAGKGTQGTRLARHGAVPHIASGDILRRRILTESGELGWAARVIDKGGMIPDTVANGIVLGELDRPAAARGFVLDGYPRDVAQARALGGYFQSKTWALDAVIFLLIEEQALVARLVGRLTCVKCGESFHIHHAPPAMPGICDRCGGAIMVRADDQPDRIRTRVALYHRKTEPLRAFYRERGVLRVVEAAGAEEEVFAAILRVLA